MKDIYNSTNSKSLNVFYGYAPKKIIKAKGVYLFDQNNRKLLDCGMALGSVSLGYAYDEVDNYVIRKIKEGVNFSRPSYLEQKLTKIINNDIKTGTSTIIRYSKSSSFLLSVIPRITRHLTQKKLIAYPKGCFLGNTDWYLSHSANSGGIVLEVRNLTLTFELGNCDSLELLFKNHAHDLACIIMEPYRERLYDSEFYNLLSLLCLKNNVILVFDETITGYRFHYPLAQYKIGCKPDFTVIGKACANGYALSAILGKAKLMNKIEQDSIAGVVFDFSTTHAGETVGLAAAIQTLNIYNRDNVVSHLNQKGEYLLALIQQSINTFALNEIFSIRGQPSYFKLHSNMTNWQNFVLQDLVKFFFNNNVLFKGTFSISLSHQKSDLDKIGETFFRYCKNFSSNVARDC